MLTIVSINIISFCRVSKCLHNAKGEGILKVQGNINYIKYLLLLFVMILFQFV